MKKNNGVVWKTMEYNGTELKCRMEENNEHRNNAGRNNMKNRAGLKIMMCNEK